MKGSTDSQNPGEQLLTTAQPFHMFSGVHQRKYLLQVQPGTPVIDAMNTSSCLLGSAERLLDHLIDGELGAYEIYAIRFLIEANKALLDSATHDVEFGNHRAGAQ